MIATLTAAVADAVAPLMPHLVVAPVVIFS